jgi:hypothetical protein
MKKFAVLTLLSFAAAVFVPAQMMAEDKTKRPSPPASAECKFSDGKTVKIDYSSPRAKGRKIFGDLVPFGQIWRTGANESTKISFSRPVKFGGVEVPAGKYALYTIPNQNEWTVILSKDTTQWGADNYSADKDAARVKAKPAALAQKVESFTIDVGDLADESATLWIAWDKTAVPVKMSVPTTEQLLSGIQQAVASTGANAALNGAGDRITSSYTPTLSGAVDTSAYSVTLFNDASGAVQHLVNASPDLLHGLEPVYPVVLSWLTHACGRSTRQVTPPTTSASCWRTRAPCSRAI